MIKIEFVNKEEYKSNFGIYGIRNKVNQKIYIGQTSENFLRRFWHHRWKLKNNKHDNNYLQHAWQKYGENNFEYIIIEVVNDKNILDALEIKYIKKFKDQNKSYNILYGGSGRRGAHMSDHAKKIVGEKNRLHGLGRKHSEATKKKMSEARTGKVVHKSTTILNEKIVGKIKIMLITGHTAAEIAKTLSISYKLINNIISNNSWKHVFVEGWDKYLSCRNTYKRLTKEDHYKIYKLYSEENYDKAELSLVYNRTQSMISKIIYNYSNKSYDNPVSSLNEGC